MNVQELRNSLEQKKGQQKTLIALLDSVVIENNSLQRNRNRLEQAMECVKLVGLRTQQQLEFRISDLVSMALSLVYEEKSYEFITRFVQRRQKSECDILFSRGGQEIDEPMDSSGGGTVHIAAFALRVVSWVLQSPRTNNVLLLDEPFPGLDPLRMNLASNMLSEISKQLNLQIICCTHSTELAECADKVFNVTIKKGISNVSVQ
jgi:DNA repair exonuclease SbcCD ATPase subunit